MAFPFRELGGSANRGKRERRERAGNISPSASARESPLSEPARTIGRDNSIADLQPDASIEFRLSPVACRAYADDTQSWLIKRSRDTPAARLIVPLRRTPTSAAKPKDDRVSERLRELPISGR